jgi:hypothetical protein
MWQLGTGYFGARGLDGKFSCEALASEVESCSRIRCIEIKLSQGAKPGKGGILPAAKVMAYTYLTPVWVIVLEAAMGQGLPGSVVAPGIGATLLALWMLLREDEPASLRQP